MERQYKNLGYFFMLLLAFVITGFFKSYFGLFPKFDKSTTLIVHFHAMVLMLWVALLIVQPLLIRAKKFKLHRLLGKFSYVLVPLIILSLIGMTNKQYNEHLAQKMPANDNLKSLIVPIAELILFTTFYSLAILNRRKVANHMRFIIATAMVLITPSIARITFFWFNIDEYKSFLFSFLLTDFILLALIVFDKSKNKNFKPYLTALTLFLNFHVVWLIWYH